MKSLTAQLFFLTLAWLTSQCFAASGEVMGCGGFVKSSKANLDLSRIQISLFEKRNKILRKVESTDCAPNNGYYFLPIGPDDRGDYVLKAVPPRGWKIEPSEFEISLDGETDQCSRGQDMNFQFIGFGITGSVLSKGSKSGPADIPIELLKSDGSVLTSATTDSDGKYDFFGVKPGEYVVQVAKEVAGGLSLDATSRKIFVDEDVGIVESFNIMGYNIEGKVLASDQKPQKGISFELINAETSKMMAKVTSDQLGKISFHKVQVGRYIIALTKDLENILELNFESQEVEVGHENVVLADFHVKSFSLSGQVKTGKKALAGVKVHVDAEDRKLDLISDDKGTFALKGISRPPLVLKAVLEGYDFDAVTVDHVEPGMKLEPLTPTRFRLSGKVDRAGFHHEITVKFKDQRDETIGKVSVTEKGQFSIYLPPGEYSVAVEVSASEQAKIGFAPLEHKAKVEDGPIGNLNFHAIKADIKGKAKCIGGNCGEKLTISLILDERPVETAPVSPDGSFQFTGVLPATYTLSISEDGKCWEEPVKQLAVIEDVKDVVFDHVGYFIAVSSTRSTLMLIEGTKSKEAQEVVISKGNNVICVKNLDNEVRFKTKGCEEFEIKPDTVDLRQLNNVNVNLKPVKYSVSGKVLSNTKIDDLQVIAKSDNRRVQLDLEEFSGGYSFNFMAFPGEDVIFYPGSAGYLFDPENLHIFVDQDCHLEVVVFHASKGHFVKGQVSPPVEDVEIKITNPESNQKFTETKTDKMGKYSLGPLPKDQYEVTASKEGYVFEAIPDGFKSKKLASIHVEVKDSEGNELKDVVVSVSGGNFRSNTKSEAGKADFLSLAPGEYFIKPQLKEYEFDPKHRMQKLKEGENAKIAWTAKRVAFSIFGKVVSLNGQPEPGITLKATSKGCGDISEEATSESDGSLRFRGLKPKCDYVITLLHGESIERMIPAEVKVTMTEADHKLPRNIVAMRAFEVMDVLLKVSDEVKQTTPSSLKISITSPDSKFHFTTKAVTGQLVPLPKVAKDNKRYDVVVETVPTKFAPQKKVTHTYVADQYVKSIKLVLNKTTTAQKQARKVSSLVYLLPLIIGAVLSYFLWDQRPQFIKNLMDTGSSSSQSTRRASADGGAAAVGDGWNAGTPNQAKRRNKKR